ncbi:hypothetical protein DYU11_07920 [Fibrisoma montanum]|uniref:Uncharacterized protein n=2 Tax=Fibrisoma montanum TaxID=2305895 RepID=A0A418MFP3_9BACT|nr:hypothetical protein DYU11_07920 [Fibrisoma montanum]
MRRSFNVATCGKAPNKYELCGMRNVFLSIIVAGLLSACGGADTTQKETATATDTTQTAAAPPEPKNCQSLIAADKLGKPDEYQESGKPIKVALTMNQDTSTHETTGGCYFNNTVTVQATKKSGSPVFKRTLLKDDLLYFTKNDEAIERAVLQKVTYKPTFNGLKYITLTMRLQEPGTRKTQDYTIFMNYFGEIIKVR